MRKILMKKRTKLEISGIDCFLKRKVTKFGTGAKVDCPKEFLDKEVYLVILENGTQKRSSKSIYSY